MCTYAITTFYTWDGIQAQKYKKTAKPCKEKQKVYQAVVFLRSWQKGERSLKEGKWVRKLGDRIIYLIPLTDLDHFS